MKEYKCILPNVFAEQWFGQNIKGVVIDSDGRLISLNEKDMSIHEGYYPSRVFYGDYIVKDSDGNLGFYRQSHFEEHYALL